MQQENIDAYALVDWGFPSGSPIKFTVCDMPGKPLPPTVKVLATGTQEEMVALMKLMDAAHGTQDEIGALKILTDAAHGN